MSWREEIKHYVYDDMRIDPDVRIDIIINKVLDAAVEEIAKVYINKKLTGPFIVYQDAINKLRCNAGHGIEDEYPCKICGEIIKTAELCDKCSENNDPFIQSKYGMDTRP